MVRIVGNIREEMAALEAERLITELAIDVLPTDPIEIAESLGILVQPATLGGVSGMLVRYGNEFGITYAAHIGNEGFERFCIAHEIGHYRIPGHIDAIFAHRDTHKPHADFVIGNRYEREADHFAASLLMPDALFTREMRSLKDGLQAIETLAARCVTSLTAAAIRYVQKARVPVAMIMSSGSLIDYCFMSEPLQDFEELERPRKGQPLPVGSETEKFNSDPTNISDAQRAYAKVELRDWFGGRRSIPGTEEIVGLGRYGKTLTILSSEVLADEGDEDELEESWESRF